MAAAKDSTQDIERGFGTGLREQLGKRRRLEAEAAPPAPPKATRENAEA